MAYKLTPEQYREAAKRRVSNQNTAENTNSAVSAYARAIDPSRGIDNKAQQTAEDTVAVSQEKNSGTDNWILQLGATVLGDVVIRPLEGTAKFVENSLLDFSAGIIATGLDWVGADDAAESVQGFAAQDFVGEAFDWEPIQAIYDSSFSNEWGKFGDILQQATYSVGEQAVPLVLSFVAGPVVSKIAFAQGAYGGSFEAASQDGGSVTGASLYGAISAGLETAIEAIGGPLSWGGKGVSSGLKQTIKNVAKSKAAQKAVEIVFGAVEEGTEEVISGALENYVKAMTYKADTASVEAYFRNIAEADPATAEELLEQFFVGAMSGAMMGGASDIIKQNSPAMQFSESSQELQELHDKAYRLNEKGRDTTAVEAEIARKEAELAWIANKYKYRLQDGYQKNKKGYGAIVSYMDNYYEKDTDGNYGASKGSLIHNQNVSYGARQADVDAALQGRAVIHQNEIKGKSAEARATVDKAVKNINKSLKGQRLSVVYADINQTAGETNYGYIDRANRVIVLDARYLGTQVDFKASDGNVYKVEAGMSTLLHEVFHDIENTKAGDKLKKFLAEYAKENSQTTFDLSSESQNDLTNEGQTQYSRRTTNYISDKTIGEDNLRVINHKLSALYAGITDGIADGIAIENGNTIYIVDSGKDNGKLDFGVKRRITVSDPERRNRYIKNINKEAAENGYGNRRIFEKLGVELDNDSSGNVGRESRKNSSADTRESANNEEGISGEIRDSRRVTGDEGVTDLVAEVKDAYPNATAETLHSELAARQLENLLLNEKVINALTQDNSTLAKRILRGAERLLAALKGENLAETKDLERILNKTIKLYNKAIAQKGKGQTVKAKSLDKREEKEYDDIKNSRRISDDGREEDGTDGSGGEKTNQEIKLQNWNNGGRGDVSFFDDSGRARQLSEIVGDRETVRKVEDFAQKIYSNPNTPLQSDLQWQAKNEEIHLYFVTRKTTTNDFYVFEGKNLFVDENATEKQLVDILNIEKPIQRNVDYTKIAKISQKRWDSFLAWKPDAYITRMPIQQFLDMTTESYVDQRSINALASQYAKNAVVEDIKNSYKDAIYLEIDFETGKVTDHEGRHRLTQLLNAGNGYVDVFVVSRSKADFESKNSLKVKGQFNDNVYPLGLVRANSQQFSAAIEATFKKDDGNIRYSRRVTHTSSEIKAATEDMVEMLTVAGNINEDLFDVSTRKNYDLKRITADINNLAAQGKLTENSKPVKQLVEAIIDSTVLTEHYEGDIQEQAILLDTLRPFLHSMNFQEEGIKAELQHKYGKENNVFRLWGKKSDGAAWDSVVQEITEIMPMLKKDSGLETLFNIIDSYTQAVADMKRVRYEARSFLSKANNEIETEVLDNGLKVAFQQMGKYNSSETESITRNANYVIAENYEDISTFVEKAEKGINGQEVLFLGKISDSVAELVEEKTQISIKGKSIALSSDDIRHIFKNHGNAKSEENRGQVAITKGNIENIIETILSPDNVTSEIEKADRISIIFEKQLNGHNIAITVLSNKKNTLTLKSARIMKNRISSSNDAQAPSSTSKTLGGMNESSTTIIHKNSEKSTQNAKKVDDGLDEIKRLMAKQLIVSLSEQGTELVTKVTADKLSETLKTERKEMQKALRAIKNGDKTVSIGDLELPQSARNQLEELSQSIAKERAAVISDKVATALVNDMRGDLTATELADLKKNVGYQLISAYVTDRYLAEGKAPSMESVRKDAAALFEALRRDVSDVKRVRDALAHNEKIVKRIRNTGYDGLKNQIRNMTVEDAYIEALDGFLAAFNQLSNADGNMRSFNEIIKKGLLKETITAFEKYFQADNPVLADMVSSGEFENIKTAVSDFKAYVDSLKTFKELSFAEREDCLNCFSVFLGAVTRAFSPETMVTINGKTVSARKYASKAIRTLEATQKRKKNGEKIDPKRGMAAHFQKYLYHIVRPNVMIGIIENSQYSDYRELGGLTGAYEDIRSGAIMGENKRLDLETIITDFWNDKKNKVGHKTYFKNLRDAMVTVQHSKGTVEMSKGEAIGLYLTLRQSDGFRHADADNASAKGIYFDLKGSIVNYAYGGEALKFTTQNVVDLENSLTEKDKQFIKVIERFMKEAAEAKGEIDRYLVGEPRLLGDDYYPLLTDETGKDRKIADKVQYYNPMDVVGHLSINQSRMNGVKALRVRNVIDTLTAYAESIGMYYGVAIPIENFRKIYNGKASNGQSLKDYIDQNISSQFKTDIEKLLLDIQGAQDIPDGFWEKRRSRFAAFQILFNLKTPFKQMSGILTLAAVLKNTSVAYGLTQTAKVFKGGQAKFDFAEMYKYCPATRVRYADHHATLAYANMENITKAMQIGGMGIELVDKWTVWIAWEACKKEVGAVGNNKNNVHLLEKAGKRLNQTLDYIDRFEITERIEFSRSPSIIKRSLAMFGSSAQAMLSQFVKHTFALSQRYYEKKHLPEMIADAKSDLQKAETRLNKAQTAYEDAKSSGDKKAIRKAAFELNQAQEEVSDCKALVGELETRQKNIESEIKRESLYTKKTIAAVTASLVAAALISQALENLLGDDEEEDENFLMSVFDETLSSIFGMFPGLGQMYNALEFDLGFYEKKSYDVSFWVIDEWQMFADAINGVIGLVDGSGTKTPARVVRDWLYALGQWYGVPFRNMYNAVNGFLNVSPTLDYKFNNLFGKGNYASDLQKAVKAGDSELAETIVGLMLKDDGGAPDTKVVRTIRSLYEQGYTGVIPRTVSSSVAIDGETYDMTTKQQKRFKQLYSQADEKIERLIGKQSFVNLSPKVQADSIKWIYDYYYQLAKYDLAGIEDDSKKALFGAHIDVETLAVAYSYCNSLEADTDKKGKAIAGSRKQKVVKYLNSLKLSAAEKYMILGYLGYSPVSQNAKTLITSYAKRNGADNNEIKEILAACNIAA